MMAYPPSYREMAPTLPSIVVPSSPRYGSPHHGATYSRSHAMAIPGVEHREVAPPPLAPPREPFGPTPQHDEASGSKTLSHSFNHGYGSISDERPPIKRRDTGGSIHGDEGYSSYSTDRSLPPPLSTAFFQSAADSMKNKLNPLRSADRSPPRSFLTASLSDLGSRKDPRTQPSVDIPIHSRSAMNSRQSSFASSPRSSHLPRTPLDHRSPMDFERSPRSRTSRNNSDDVAMHGHYDYHVADEMEIDDARRMHPDERHLAGQKRRAASPPPDDHAYYLAHGHPDALRRRELVGTRSSPTPRLSSIPQGHPASPASSGPGSRSNSYLSSISIPTTAATSYSHRSPPGPSPTSCSSPYATANSLNPSPRSSISRTPLHARIASGGSPRKVMEVGKLAGGKTQGFLMCDCCPKKPKKFETAEELHAHTAEKQYECSYCGNRFKNKNEAERHQNSLHVRRHSWSCSALHHCDRAFHESTTRPGEADTCGYCGDEFPRSGSGPGAGVMNGGVVPRHATDADWEERVRHLEEVHKFRECNASKKFYRADHFRQHLKHSHAGTSGKWTNMLENACLLDEEPPMPR